MGSKDALMVLSGGMDSVTMLHDYISTIESAVYFHYGSNHEAREAECARRQCEIAGVELTEIDLGFMATHFSSSLLAGGDAVPSGDYAESNMLSTVVPFRNGIMLAVAAGLAESRGLKAVMLANHAGDHSVYPDCRPKFIDAMGSAISLGTYAGIELRAPYTGLTKADIARRGKSLGVDYSLTYSCYRGGERHCGTCATCLERRQALVEAGIFIDD